MFLERALVKSHERIRQKLGAFRAEFAFGLMVTSAVYVNHGVDGFFLSCYSRMLLAQVFSLPFLKTNVKQEDKIIRARGLSVSYLIHILT